MTGQAAHSFKFQLHRPYLDLTRSLPDGPLMGEGPLLAWEAREVIRAGGSPLGTQRILVGEFRVNLLRECRASGYAALDPREASPRARSARWQELCELVDGFAGLGEADQVWLVRLLVYLGFHDLVQRLLPRPARADIGRSAHAAELAHLRAFARFMRHTGRWRGYQPDDLVDVLEAADPHTRAYHEAAKCLLVYEGKAHRSALAARELAAAMEPYARRAEAELPPVASLLLRSAHYRAVSYVPFLDGRADDMTATMDQAEDLAREAVRVATEPTDRLVARDNLHPLLESRMREALARDDQDLALARIREVVESVDPWDSKARIELGELLWLTGDHQAARHQFLLAALLGPPGTQIGAYMAGQCSAELGDLAAAATGFLAALELDPLAISPAEALRDAATAIGQGQVAAWATDHLTTVGAPSRADASRADASQAEASQATPSQAEGSQAEASRARAVGA